MFLLKQGKFKTLRFYYYNAFGFALKKKATFFRNVFPKETKNFQKRFQGFPEVFGLPFLHR